MFAKSKFFSSEKKGESTNEILKNIKDQLSAAPNEAKTAQTSYADDEDSDLLDDLLDSQLTSTTKTSTSSSQSNRSNPNGIDEFSQLQAEKNAADSENQNQFEDSLIDSYKENEDIDLADESNEDLNVSGYENKDESIEDDSEDGSEEYDSENDSSENFTDDNGEMLAPLQEIKNEIRELRSEIDVEIKDSVLLETKKSFNELKNILTQIQDQRIAAQNAHQPSSNKNPFESMVYEMLESKIEEHLSKFLDENLPNFVNRAVKNAIDKIVEESKIKS